jgi:hypothetical protein
METNETIWSTLLVLLSLTLVSMVLYMIYYTSKFKVNKKRTELSNKLECDRRKQEDLFRNWYDFFWSNPMRFWWILLFLSFFVLFGLSIDKTLSYSGLGLIFSFISVLTLAGFLVFAYKSYYWFPKKAEARLEEFEAAIVAGIRKETDSEEDKIHEFAKKDKEFDTEPIIFKFPVDIAKCDYPLFETNPKKKPIIKSRKLEFLVLSGEYFNICKSATAFNLTNPERLPLAKKCAEKRAAGGCKEYYYSQMKNVYYDMAKEAIVIKYYNDIDDVEFAVKKVNPDRTKAVKELRKKLRIKERQILKKIEEQNHYESIKNRRDYDSSTNTEE